MARRRKKSKKSDQRGISDGVKQSIAAVVLAAIGVIILLAFSGSAGVLGEFVNEYLAYGFGWDRWLVAIVLFAVAWSVMFPDRRLLGPLNVAGIMLFFVSFNGLLNLLLLDPVTATSFDIARAGGYVGMAVFGPLVGLLGFAGSFVFSLAGLVVGFLLTFNVSIQAVAELPGALLARRSSDEEDDYEEEAYEEEYEDEEEYAEEENEDFEEEEEPQYAGADHEQEEMEPETVMTSKRRRRIQVPVDLLDDSSSEAKAGDVDRNAEIIRKTFEHFNIDVEMVDVRVGPTVTQYSLRPAQGIKLSRIVGLQNDLALALAAHPIRIEAPIPGKALVGIEVPNQSVGRVTIRELLESKEFKRRKSAMTSPLGKDVAGAVQSVMVDKAPHMLVAGATGSGKSVCLNVIITSLLYQNGPDDLKLIMVDPKRVELGVYTGIPHLLVPPITKVEEAINALKWAVREMERRLDHLAKNGARDIDSYNAKTKERMPKIVIVIDELADLMSQNKRDVEAVIVRIAQMARAAGIHLILATQRPSVDVITGTIKANIPTRLAFAVASQVDSKTILDVSGAEKLLGRGDMLMSTPALSKPHRAQGAYVSDGEIERVVKFLKKEGEPDYNYQVTEDTRSGGVALDAEDSDPLLQDAIAIVIDSNKASTSYLQRRLKIGYSRAARIMDIMFEIGIIGEARGSKPREVLVEEWPPKGARKEEADLADAVGPGDDEEEEYETEEDYDEEEGDEDTYEEDEEYEEEDEEEYDE